MCLWREFYAVCCLAARNYRNCKVVEFGVAGALRERVIQTSVEERGVAHRAENQLVDVRVLQAKEKILAAGGGVFQCDKHPRGVFVATDCQNVARHLDVVAEELLRCGGFKRHLAGWVIIVEDVFSNVDRLGAVGFGYDNLAPTENCQAEQ